MAKQYHSYTQSHTQKKRLRTNNVERSRISVRHLVPLNSMHWRSIYTVFKRIELLWNRQVVEMRRIELLTSALRTQRSPS